MRYINPNSRRGVVNKLADYILSKIDSSNKTRIQVTDFKAFYVINGETQSNKVLDLNAIKEGFFEENRDLLHSLEINHINIIDLIQYREPIGQLEYYFDIFNSSRPLFHQSVIDEVQTTQLNYNTKHLNSVNYTNRVELEFSYPYDYSNLNKYHYTEFLSVSSEFPYGYSLDMGRSSLYYTEYVCNHLLSHIQYNRLEFKITRQVDSEDDLLISINTTNPSLDKQLKSLVLDVFDFNLKKFQHDFIDGYDLTNEIDAQLMSKPWLVKDRVSDIILF